MDHGLPDNDQWPSRSSSSPGSFFRYLCPVSFVVPATAGTNTYVYPLLLSSLHLPNTILSMLPFMDRLDNQ
jgi:hypothetical protein